MSVVILCPDCHDLHFDDACPRRPDSRMRPELVEPYAFAADLLKRAEAAEADASAFRGERDRLKRTLAVHRLALRMVSREHQTVPDPDAYVSGVLKDAEAVLGFDSDDPVGGG